MVFIYADCILGKEEKFQHKWHSHGEAGISKNTLIRILLWFGHIYCAYEVNSLILHWVYLIVKCFGGEVIMGVVEKMILIE